MHYKVSASCRMALEAAPRPRSLSRTTTWPVASSRRPLQKALISFERMPRCEGRHELPSGRRRSGTQGGRDHEAHQVVEARYRCELCRNDRRCRRCDRKRCKRRGETDPGGHAHMLTFGQHRAARRFSTQCELPVSGNVGRAGCMASPERQAPTEAARDVEADLRAALCGAGPDPTQAGILI